jgi:hypothetical protein
MDFHHSSSFLESLCTILAASTPSTPTWLTPAPELGTAEGSPKAALRSEKNAPDDPPSVNRTIQTKTVVILDRPLPPPTLSPATDITITSPPQQELDAEHTGGPPRPDGALGGPAAPVWSPVTFVLRPNTLDRDRSVGWDSWWKIVVLHHVFDAIAGVRLGSVTKHPIPLT